MPAEFCVCSLDQKLQATEKVKEGDRGATVSVDQTMHTMPDQGVQRREHDFKLTGGHSLRILGGPMNRL